MAVKGDVKLNQMVHIFVDECFAESQVMATRRLTDRRQGMYSLTSLLEDIHKHVNLMTRENLFRAEGLECDIDATTAKCDEYLLQNKGFVKIPEKFNWRALKIRRAQIDFLAGVNSGKGLLEDRVRSRILSNLKKKVQTACKDLKTYANDFLAHAAPPWRRAADDADDIRPTLAGLDEAHKAICEVANFVDIYLLGESGGISLPLPQYNQFAHIDTPLFTKEGIETLGQIWKEYEDKTEQWANWDIEGYRREFEKDTGV